MLSKTDILHAVQCPKRLWLHHHSPEHHVEPKQSFAQEQGQRVGEAARKAFPGGILVNAAGTGNMEAALQETSQQLNSETATLFEAAFSAEGLIVYCDILTRLPQGGWRLIEVKSGARLKSHYVLDIGLQWHVIKASGLDLREAWIYHLRRDFRAGEPLSTAFTQLNVTQDVIDSQQEIAQQIDEARQARSAKKAPDILPGEQCGTPYACPYLGHCKASLGVEDAAVVDIPRLSSKTKRQLRMSGVAHLGELPDDLKLSPGQRQHIKRVLDQRIDLDIGEVRRLLGKLRFPLHFVDFETVAYALPQFPGTRPFSAVPFQFSCHIMHEDGGIEERAFLHDSKDDPRGAFAAALLEAIGNRGSLIAYGAAFEKRILQSLKPVLPDLTTQLDGLTTRFQDQLKFFRRAYQHYAFGGSRSIKRVATVLAPDINYEALNLRSGEDAQLYWQHMLKETDPKRRQRFKDDLLAYCRLDTWSMVRIHQELQRIAAD